MKVRLVWVGRTHDAALAGWIEEYRKRISRFCPIEILETRDAPGRSVARASREKREMASRIGDRGVIVRLDEGGREMSSHEFASFLRDAIERLGEITFLLGGPDGWGASPSSRARPGETLLSLSRLTLPHEMARVVLLEQIYRAFTILKGLPYHR